MFATNFIQQIAGKKKNPNFPNKSQHVSQLSHFFYAEREHVTCFATKACRVGQG